MSKINCQWTLVLRSEKSNLNGLKELTLVQYSSVRSVQPNAGEVLKLSSLHHLKMAILGLFP